MALPSTAVRSLACVSCRQLLLRSFIASIGGPPIAPSSSRTRPPHCRTLSTTPRAWDGRQERIQREARDDQEPHVLNDINEDFRAPELSSDVDTHEATAPPSSTVHEAQYVPWYLQVDPQMAPQENRVSSRQKIPELPDHAPPILQSLVQRISVELGMDDLSILDLRGIDPPPALGANLLMIIGTARSEKHLHFSADKLCRWLRTEHRATSYADGLLGRQELKLKLKRRAKKSKLMSAVGAKSAADTELDEGIRTGWICVNVGKVEGGELPKTEEQLKRESDIVGFGSSTTGTNIVVQLLTEERRGQMDLEKLWSTVLRKSTKEREELEEEVRSFKGEGLSSPEKAIDSMEARVSGPAETPPQNSAFHPFSLASPSQLQVRAYHTSTRRFQASAAHSPLVSNSSQRGLTSSNSDPLTDGATEPLATLTSFLNSVERMPPDLAMSTLGKDFPGELTIRETALERPPTSAISSAETFYNTMPAFPDAAHWHVHVQLICLAQRLGHPNCTCGTILETLTQMQLAGLVPLEKTYITVLISILRDPPNISTPPEPILNAVFDLLEEMEMNGYDALRPNILELLHQHLVGQLVVPTPTTLQSLIPAVGLARLKHQLQRGNVDGFWQTWDSYPRRMMSRPAEMYVVLFEAIAEQKLGSLELRVTRGKILAHLSEMEAEQPPVILEQECVELAVAIFKSLQHVDPESADPQWDDMRQRCQDILKSALD